MNHTIIWVIRCRSKCLSWCRMAVMRSTSVDFWNIYSLVILKLTIFWENSPTPFAWILFLGCQNVRSSHVQPKRFNVLLFYYSVPFPFYGAVSDQWAPMLTTRDMCVLIEILHQLVSIFKVSKSCEILRKKPACNLYIRNYTSDIG